MSILKDDCAGVTPLGIQILVRRCGYKNISKGVRRLDELHGCFVSNMFNREVAGIFTHLYLCNKNSR
jgi:hypothetical protein